MSEKKDESPVQPSGPSAAAATPIAKRTPPSLLKPQSEMVTVFIGSAKEKFVIHKDFLTYHSPYFAKCLEGRFAEAATNIVTLDHTSSEAFGLLVQWIYYKYIKQVFADKFKKAREETEEERVDFVPPSPKTLIDLWILADYLQMPELQNTTIDLIILKSDDTNTIATPQIAHIYKETLAGSPLRKLFVDFCSWQLKASSFQSNAEEFPQEMLISLAISLIARVEEKSPSPLLDPTNYYVKVDT